MANRKFVHHYQEWVELYQQGQSVDEIGRKYGSNGATVWHALKKLGLPLRPTKNAKGDQHRLLREAWAQLYQSGLDSWEIAERYGVGQATICRHLAAAGVVLKTNSEAHRRYRIGNEIAFDLIDSEPKAYWLGFLMADGSVSDGSNPSGHKWVLQVSLQERDEIHLEKLAAFLDTDSPIRPIPKKAAFHFSVRSEPLVTGLIRCGCTPRKSLTLQFPAATVPETLLSPLARGYFDGDGSVFSTGTGVRAGWSCGSLDFLKALHMVVAGQTGIASMRYDLPRNRQTKSLMVERRDDVRRLYEWLYRDSTVYLDRKKQKFEELLCK